MLIATAPNQFGWRLFAIMIFIVLSELLISVYVVITPSQKHSWAWHERNKYLPEQVDLFQCNQRVATHFRRSELGTIVLATLLPGQSKHFIKQLLKQDGTETSLPIDSLRDPPVASILFLLTDSTLLLCFDNNDQCVAAQIYDSHGRRNFEHMKAMEVLINSRKKRAAEIKAQFGNPTREYETTAHELFPERYVPKSGDAKLDLLGVNEPAQPKHYECWDYQTSESSGMNLILENGICISGIEYEIFH